MRHPEIGSAQIMLVLLAMSAGCTAPGRLLLRVEQKQIQQRIDARFPQKIKRLVFEVRLERPAVLLSSATNRLELQLRVTGVVLGAPVGHAAAMVTGGVRYDSKRREFLLTDPRVVRFEASHLPEKYVELARGVVDRFVVRTLPEIPIYQLDSSKHRFAAAMLKRAWVCDGKLCLELGF